VVLCFCAVGGWKQDEALFRRRQYAVPLLCPTHHLLQEHMLDRALKASAAQRRKDKSVDSEATVAAAALRQLTFVKGPVERLERYALVGALSGNTARSVSLYTLVRF
jgi:hypothetical protein